VKIRATCPEPVEGFVAKDVDAIGGVENPPRGWCPTPIERRSKGADYCPKLTGRSMPKIKEMVRPQGLQIPKAHEA